MKLPSLLLLLGSLASAAAPGKGPYPLEIREWKVVPSESGPINYYRLLEEPGEGPFLRGSYTPPLKTVVMGHEVPVEAQRGIGHLRWRWRVQTLPVGANECVAGKGDSAATVFAVWKRGLAWYSLKFVWSAGVPSGTVCAHHGSPVHREDTVVLESGGPLNSWREENVDLSKEFRRHFARGNENLEVPRLVGVGILTDGDQSQSRSAGDYARFVLEP